MNRKGQVLVVFVILLPLFMMFIAYIIDNGIIAQNRVKLDELTKSIIIYALEDRSRTMEEVTEYIVKNEPNLKNVNVLLDEDVQIQLVKTVPSVFGKAIGIQQYTITSYYEGELKDGEMILRKVER